MQKLYLEDLNVGDRFVSREYELTEEKIKSFAKEYDPQPFHLDADAATKHPIFQGLAGSGWQTAAITMRLWTECMPLAGGLVGFGGDIQWKLPTRVNDRLHIEVEITDIRRSKSKPLQGVVSYLTLTKNQHGQVVQQSTTNVLVWSKEAPNLPEY
ncbi:MaoC family dehydratase [Acinetobacter puyangensis]|uniref:Acyl dehydratase n=1 Tax=Acinetobacter puyangensis TaxID=1096779 RepID=A0A240ECF6_9GAMM|nr:MaoC family dehydratase [Acinetobacter puyangensis]SNX46372.1 Acyl dehydratase [Acinetobacter puyangensis]